MSKKQLIGGPLMVNGQPLPLSKAVRAQGDFLFVSGQLPLDNGKVFGDDIRAQTRKTLENLTGIITGAGAALKDVVKCTVWLTEQSDFAVFNEVYREFFSAAPPARSCVISGLAIPGAKVEIEAIVLMP